MLLNNKEFSGCALNNQELQLVLNCIQGIHQINRIQSLSAYFDNICKDVLPCAYGGIGVLNKNTNVIQWLVRIGENGPKTNQLRVPVYADSSINQELVSAWLKSHQVLFLRGLVAKGLLECLTLKGDVSQSGNLIFDGVTKERNENICFYYLYNIDEHNFPKYQIIMRLLLLNIYEPLVSLLRTNVYSKTAIVREQISELTEREKQIIHRIRRGLNNKNIARQLNISVNTVKCHIYNIFQKLQVSNRVEALLIAEKAGYLN